MNTYNFDVNFTTGRIYGPDLLLVVNDHNSTTFKFTFDQEGRYVFKLLYPDNTVYVQDIINGELVLTKGVLNQEGNYKFEISLYGDDNRLTTARIKEFPVRLELVETDEPVQADDRLPILDNLIEETNKVVEAAKNGEFDGATFTPSVSDNGDLSWTNDKGKENPPTVNIKGEKGDPGAVKMQVVDTLPQIGDTDTIYLLKKDTPDEQNLYDEYVYTEASGWEHIGDTSVDLTDYYTKEETNKKLNTKQDTLIAGDNITIEDNVISASNSKNAIYSIEFNNVSLPQRNTIYANDFGNYEQTLLDFISNTLNNSYLKNQTPIIFMNFNCSNFISDIPYLILNKADSRTILSAASGLFYMLSDVKFVNNKCYYYRVEIRYTYENNIFTCTMIKFTKKQRDMLDIYNALSKENTTSFTPTSDYNPATKKYVDDSIAAASSIPIYDFKMTSQFTKYNPPTTYTYMTSTDKTTLQNIIQSAYDKGLESVVLIARQKYGTYTGTNEQTQDYLLTTVNNSKNLIKNKPTALMLDGYNHGSMTMSDNHLSRLSILFTLKWSGDTCTVGQAQYINKDITIATQTDYQTYAGYDATKTQVLKNVNGTLTWITEE